MDVESANGSVAADAAVKEKDTFDRRKPTSDTQRRGKERRGQREKDANRESDRDGRRHRDSERSHRDHRGGDDVGDVVVVRRKSGMKGRLGI